jgi:hypothetical protein
VSDGIRTHDRLDHNQELYQLSYAHREGTESSNGPDSRGLRGATIRLPRATAAGVLEG